MKKNIPAFLDDILHKIETGIIAAKYSHKTEITQNKIQTDCSGLVNYVLEQTGRNAAIKEILHYKYLNQKNAQDWNRLFVTNFVSALENVQSDNWLVLSDIEQLQDGDMIFSQNPVRKQNTNHVMFARGVEKINDNTYRIRVMDSTTCFIHLNDSRNAPGIGIGDIIIGQQDDGNYRCDFGPNNNNLLKKLLFARAI